MNIINSSIFCLAALLGPLIGEEGVATLEPGYMPPIPGKFTAYTEFETKNSPASSGSKYRFAEVNYHGESTRQQLYVVIRFSYPSSSPVTRKALRCKVEFQRYLASEMLEEGSKDFFGEEAVDIMNAIDSSELFSSNLLRKNRWLPVNGPLFMGQEDTDGQASHALRVISASEPAKFLSEYLKRKVGAR